MLILYYGEASFSSNYVTEKFRNVNKPYCRYTII